MTDAVFLPSSPWVNDFWLPRDVGQFSSDHDGFTSELPFDALDSDGCHTAISPSFCQTDKSEWDSVGFSAISESEWNSSLIGSTDVSVANSECSDELSNGDVDAEVDLEEAVDLDVFLDEVTAKAFLTGSNTSLAGLTSDAGYRIEDKLHGQDTDHELHSSVCINPLRWRDDSSDDNDDGEEELSVDGDHHDNNEDESRRTVTTMNRLPTLSTSATPTSLSDILDHNINWTSLSTLEQYDLVEHLSAIVSTRLGLREQLEVIRVIRPGAQVLATDTQFVIDVASLSNQKLNQIQTLLTQHLHRQDDCGCHDNNNNSSSSSCGSRGSSRSPKSQRSTRHNSGRSKTVTCHCNCSNNKESSSSSKSTATAKEKPKPLTAAQRRQQQRKRKRQELKERRSGLFVREEVLAVCRDPNDEDTGTTDNEVVDILS